MESSDQARKIISFILFLVFFGVLAWAAQIYVSSPLLMRLTQHQDGLATIVVLTEPAMQISYNPALHKAVVTFSDSPCAPDKLLTCFNSSPNGYFIPRQTDQTLFWEDFKFILSRWRYNPLLIGKTAWAYIRARYQKQTDLDFAEFITMGLALSRLQISDFTLSTITKNKPKKSRKQPVIVTEVSPDKLLTDESNQKTPLKIEILNASGRKGLAKNLTQYLRRQTSRGLLNVDVMQYDNYRKQIDQTEIIDFSGRIIQVSHLAHAIGFKREVKKENTPNDICDTRIILGKDFEMPL